jgi:hypothetical protein
VASEYADGQAFLWVVCICIGFSVIVGRSWTLALPVVLAAPEDVQAGVLFGAVYGLGLAATALLVRHIVARAISKRRAPHTR